MDNNVDTSSEVQKIMYNGELRDVKVIKDKNGDWVGFEVINPQKRGRKKGWRGKYRKVRKDESKH